MSPNTDRRLDRRRFLKIGGVAGIAAVAGCLGDEEEPEPAEPDEPEEEEPDDDPEEPIVDDEEEEEELEDLPDPTDTETALIEPATLHEWQEAGLVNLEEVDERDRVVVLRIDDWYPDDGEIQSYEDGHIPGAVPWEVPELHGERLEGLANVAPVVANGEMMDQLIDKAGICPRTTIVVSGSKPIRTARGYWTLRYWGFPKERVKLLNGGYHAYGEEYDLETGDFNPLDIPNAEYSVRAHEELNNDLRLGIAQMIQRVDNLNAGESNDVILENRQDGEGDDATAPDVMIQHAVWDNPLAVHEGNHHFEYFEGDGAFFKSPEAIAAHYDELEADLDGADEIITYCGSGYRAAVSFFLLDGVLGYDNVMLYDGSFSRQWVQYAGDDVPEEWRVDMHDRTDGEFEPAGIDIVVDEIPELETAEANQLEAADIQYMQGEEADEENGNGNGDWGCSIVPPATGP